MSGFTRGFFGVREAFHRVVVQGLYTGQKWFIGIDNRVVSQGIPESCRRFPLIRASARVGIRAKGLGYIPTRIPPTRFLRSAPMTVPMRVPILQYDWCCEVFAASCFVF